MGEFTIFEALNTTVIAMLMVFTLLIVLMGIIYFQTYLIKKFSDKKKVKTEVDALEESLKEEEIFEDNSNDEEVVAAIMAVLSCYMDVPKNKIQIKSIKRVQGDASAWGNAGLQNRVK